MHLIQYAYRVPKENRINTFNFFKSDKVKSFFYTQRNYLIRDLLWDLYTYRKGKKNFNDVYVEIRKKDVREIIKAIKQNNNLSDDYKEDALIFFEQTKKILEQGDCVYYYNLESDL